jgi:hypothetical protein
MRALLLLSGLVTTLCAGCGDSVEPRPFNLRVSVSTSGADGDTAYTIRVGEDLSRPVRVSVVMQLPPGDHSVRLEGVATNCSVQGPDSARVTIVADELASVTFHVACRALTGVIEVIAPTSGRDFDPDGYTVELDDVVRGRVYARVPAVLERVPPGTHVITLSDFSANCILDGPPTRTVVVTAGGFTRDTTRTAFQSSCLPITGDVRLVTTTEGVAQDPDGYTMTVDGELVIEPCGFYDYGCEPGQPLKLSPNSVHDLYLVSPGEHTYEIGDIASSCAVADGSFRMVAVAVGVTTVVGFDVRCEASEGRISELE